MLANFLLLAARQFRRNFIYTTINVLGLSVGLAGSFVIGSWVLQEVSYDKHFEASDRIYRVSIGFYNSGAFASGPEILNTTLMESAPEVELATRVRRARPTSVYIENEKYEEKPLFVDSAFFQVFDHEFLNGDLQSAISEGNTMVISTTLARKYFNSEDVLGRTILYGEDKVPYQISGIIKLTDSQTHLETEMWMPLKVENSSNWLSARYFNYIKLYEGFTKQDLDTRLETIKSATVYPTFEANTPYEQWSGTGIYDFFVTALTDIHLDPTMRFDLQEGGNRANVQVFTVVAIFLLVIAVINFINLSTAQAVKRAKEVGVRKVLGTTKDKLIIQYLTESIGIGAVAMLAGIGLAEVFLILFQSFTNEVLINDLFLDTQQILIYLAVGIVTGILAGIYPAFHLSGYRPVDALKAKVSDRRSSGFRSYLVVVQFTISVTLIISSLVVYQQLGHLRVVDLGFDRENVLVINNASALGDSKNAFKEKLLQHNDVQSASFNKRVPAGSSVWLYSFQSKAMEQGEGLQTFIGDHQYLETVGFRLLKGRNFREVASDSNSVILTESAVKTLLLTRESALGTELTDGRKVIGVVSDFSYQNFKERPDPVAIIYEPDGYRLSLKLKGNQTASFLDYLRSEWQSFSVDQPLNFSFVDDNFELLMEKEKTLGHTITFFTGIAIFISCLGLFGLAAFTTQQREKEIGIRKVLGASISQILMLLNRGFTRLVIFAVIIAIPLALYVTNQWLQNFEYKTPLNVSLFALAGFSAIVIAWLTVSFFLYRSATSNPVETLKEE